MESVGADGLQVHGAGIIDFDSCLFEGVEQDFFGEEFDFSWLKDSQGMDSPICADGTHGDVGTQEVPIEGVEEEVEGDFSFAATLEEILLASEEEGGDSSFVAMLEETLLASEEEGGDSSFVAMLEETLLASEEEGGDSSFVAMLEETLLASEEEEDDSSFAARLEETLLAGEEVVRKRKRAAVEPEEHVHKEKTCTNCGSHDCTFRYLNNKKRDQPRYKCKECGMKFGLYDHGRAKVPKTYKPRYEEPEHLRAIQKKCPKCMSMNMSRFLYYNNDNVNQPRYACSVCKKKFQLFPKRTKLL